MTDDDRDDAYENGDESEYDDGDEECTPIEQLERAQRTAAKLEGQLDVLHGMLEPANAPPSPLANFLRLLETNAPLRQKWIADPDAAIENSSLPPEDKAALRSGGVDAVNTRLQ